MSARSVKVLDCTLRDGGYLIDWNFSEQTIQSILNNLSDSGVDFIECGFLKECVYNKDKSFFSSVADLEKLAKNGQNYTLMVNYGEYDISRFTECRNKNIKIRVAFKKHDCNEALKYISALKNLGWEVFVNPMSTNTYTKEELSELITEINTIEPFGLSIVDTLGNMYENEAAEIFEFADKILNSKIALGFHSHNSMQLSFSNTQVFLRLNTRRDLVIDSCLYGMGRGAGNLCTELITQYLSDNFGKEYVISPLIKIIDTSLKQIYDTAPWGYSTPYYIAAIHGCHPNYAGYLVQNHFSNEEINRIISNIPQDKKTIYDRDFIKDLADK